MPNNLFQKIVFTCLTVAMSVVVFVLYNQALLHGSMSNEVFRSSGLDILMEFPIAFACQMLIAGPLSMVLARRIVTPSVDHPRIIVLTITFMTIAIMCPLMSLLSTALHRGVTPELGAQWLQAMFLNFPVAVFAQFFFVGPFVRMLFRGMFKKPSLPAGLSTGLAQN